MFASIYTINTVICTINSTINIVSSYIPVLKKTGLTDIANTSVCTKLLDTIYSILQTRPIFCSESKFTQVQRDLVFLQSSNMDIAL